MKTIQESLLLLVIGVNIIGSIPFLRCELVKIIRDVHASLLQVEELISHKLDQSRWDVGFTELGLEVITWSSGCMA
jgi:hypothetical protein